MDASTGYCEVCGDELLEENSDNVCTDKCYDCLDDEAAWGGEDDEDDEDEDDDYDEDEDKAS